MTCTVVECVRFPDVPTTVTVYGPAMRCERLHAACVNVRLASRVTRPSVEHHARRGTRALRPAHPAAISARPSSHIPPTKNGSSGKMEPRDGTAAERISCVETVIVAMAGFPPGVSEFGETVQVPVGLEQLSPMALLNAPPLTPATVTVNIPDWPAGMFRKAGAAVMVKSVATACELTTVGAVAELLALLGSGVALAIVAVLLRLPATVGRMTRVNVAAGAPEARVAMVHVTVPPAPTAGVVQAQPAGEVSDWNVVFAGSMSVIVSIEAGDGPALVTVIV